MSSPVIRWTLLLALLAGCRAAEPARPSTQTILSRNAANQGKPRKLELLSRLDDMGPPFGREFGDGPHVIDVVNQSQEVRYLPPLGWDTFPDCESMEAPHEGRLRMEPGESVRIWCDLPGVSPGTRLLIRTLVRRPHPGSWEGFGLERWLMPTVLEFYDLDGARQYASRPVLGVELGVDLTLFMEMSSDTEHRLD